MPVTTVNPSKVDPSSPKVDDADEDPGSDSDVSSADESEEDEFEEEPDLPRKGNVEPTQEELTLYTLLTLTKPRNKTSFEPWARDEYILVAKVMRKMYKKNYSSNLILDFIIKSHDTHRLKFNRKICRFIHFEADILNTLSTLGGELQAEIARIDLRRARRAERIVLQKALDDPVYKDTLSKMDVKKFPMDPLLQTLQAARAEMDVSNVELATQKFLLIDGQVNMTGGACPILLDFGLQHGLRYSDSIVYDREKKFHEEIQFSLILDDLIAAGAELRQNVYCYRCVSRCIPPLDNVDGKFKLDMIRKAFTLMWPECIKVETLMIFCSDAVTSLSLVTEWLGKWALSYHSYEKHKHGDKFTWHPAPLPINILRRLIDVIDICVILDHFKDKKPSMSSDLLIFKRLYLALKDEVDPSTGIDEIYFLNLSLFLSTPRYFMTAFQERIDKFPAVEEALFTIVHYCLERLKGSIHITPFQKFSVLRTLIGTCGILDGRKDDSGKIINVWKDPRVDIDSVLDYMLELPVLPLYGDMQFLMYEEIKEWRHTPRVVVEQLAADVNHSQYQYAELIGQIREKHNDFVGAWGSMTGELRTLSSDHDVRAKKAPIVKDMVLEGFTLLSQWSALVLEMHALKLAIPRNRLTIDRDEILAGTPSANLSDWELAIKYNYDEEEKTACVECCAMIKGLGAVMKASDSLLHDILRRGINIEIQSFALTTLTIEDRIASFTCCDPKLLKAICERIRAVANLRPGQKVVDIKKETAPSSTQLYLLESLIHELYIIVKKDQMAEPQLFETLEKMSTWVFFYRYVLDYNGTWALLTDLSDLWLREFFLENCNVVQFPVDSSLPWMLTSYCVESSATYLVEYFVFTLDIYNDVAARALNRFRKRHIFNEIEAEVKLVFDQVIHAIATRIYVSAKRQASSLTLHKSYKDWLMAKRDWDLLPPKRRYQPLLSLRHLELIGRLVDFGSLIGIAINKFIHRDITYILQSFESQELIAIESLYLQLQVVRLTHETVNEFILLDSFDDILRELDENVSYTAVEGRILSKIVYELIYDIFPNYGYNTVTERYVRCASKVQPKREKIPRSTYSLNDVYGSREFARAFIEIQNYRSGFFGQSHCKIILDLVGSGGMHLIISELCSFLKFKVRQVILPQLSKLGSDWPKSFQLPNLETGSFQCVNALLDQLIPYLQYEDLYSTIYHSLKEMGNAIAFICMLDSAMALNETIQFVQVAPLLGITPEKASDPTVFAGSSLVVSTQRSLSRHLKKLGIVREPAALSYLTSSVSTADDIYRLPFESGCAFRTILGVVDETIDAERIVFNGLTYETAKMRGTLEVSNIQQAPIVCRVFTMLQFFLCVDMAKPESDFDKDLFGDGVHWAIQCFMECLGHKNIFESMSLLTFLSQVDAFDTSDNDSMIGNIPVQSIIDNCAQTNEMNQLAGSLMRYVIPKEPQKNVACKPPDEAANKHKFDTEQFSDEENILRSEKKSVLEKTSAASCALPSLSYE